MPWAADAYDKLPEDQKPLVMNEAESLAKLDKGLIDALLTTSITKPEVPEGYLVKPLGYGAVIFTTHNENAVDTIALKDVAAIIGDSKALWQDVGSDPGEIQFKIPSARIASALEVLFSFPDLTDWVDTSVRTPLDIPTYALEGPDYGLELFSWADYSFGMTTDSYISSASDRIKLLAIDGVLPSDESIREGHYPLSYGTYLIYREKIDWTKDLARLLGDDQLVVEHFYPTKIFLDYLIDPVITDQGSQ